MQTSTLLVSASVKLLLSPQLLPRPPKTNSIMPKVWLLDYGAGNVRSLRNALAALGFEVVDITSPAQIADAGVLVFPGVGSFGACMATLAKKGYTDALRAYVRADRPFLGICLGLQTLFEGSEESPGVAGLGIIPATVRRFRVGEALAVPQIGWNGVAPCKPSALLAGVTPSDAVYFVHSFRVADAAELDDWALCLTDYGERYVSAVQRGRVAAVQFHPEKSGAVGLQILRNFLGGAAAAAPPLRAPPPTTMASRAALPTTRFCRRVIACLDVRANDAGDLVVTKGDQYDVREAKSDGSGAGGEVRNLGKPVMLADVWPSSQEIADLRAANIDRDMFTSRYANVYEGDEHWRAITVEASDTYQWNPTSTYVASPPFFDGMKMTFKQVPQTWLVNSEGEIVFQIDGVMDEDGLEALLHNLNKPNHQIMRHLCNVV